MYETKHPGMKAVSMRCSARVCRQRAVPALSSRVSLSGRLVSGRTVVSPRHRRRCGGLKKLRHAGEQRRQRRRGFGRRLDDEAAAVRPPDNQIGNETLDFSG